MIENSTENNLDFNEVMNKITKSLEKITLMTQEEIEENQLNAIKKQLKKFLDYSEDDWIRLLEFQHGVKFNSAKLDKINADFSNKSIDYTIKAVPEKAVEQLYFTVNVDE